MEFLRQISLQIHDLADWIFLVLPAVGGLTFYFGLVGQHEKIQRAGWFLPVLFCGATFLFWNFVTAEVWPKVPKFKDQLLGVSLLCWAGGLLFAWVFARFSGQQVEKLKSKTVKKSALARGGKTDVRSIAQVLPAVQKPFDPRSHWHEKGVFLGLDGHGKPVRSSWPLRHMQVTGTSGCGKGVLLSQVALEMAARGEAVFFIDPKNDEWAPSVCAEAESFHFMDLNAACAQMNIFEGCSEREIYELFLAGFSLGEKGRESDFYRISDRDAARNAAGHIFAGDLTGAAAFAQYGAELAKMAPAFGAMLKEMALVPAVNAPSGTGLSLAKIVNDGGLVYFVGSMRNTEVIRIQRMLLVRLIQLAESRDRSAEAPRQICAVLDELKYHLSRPALEALGAARDKGMHVVLAYQSLADLRDCPADLDGDAVVGAIFENTPIKVTYRVEDVNVAEMLAQKSGKIQVDDETRQLEVGAAGVERLTDRRSIRQTETTLVDQNMLHNLKPTQAVVFGASSLPQFITTAPIRVQKKRLQPVAAVPIEQLEALSKVDIKPLEGA